jgi:hypothetical protein
MNEGIFHPAGPRCSNPIRYMLLEDGIAYSSADSLRVNCNGVITIFVAVRNTIKTRRTPGAWLQELLIWNEVSLFI